MRFGVEKARVDASSRFGTVPVPALMATLTLAVTLVVPANAPAQQYDEDTRRRWSEVSGNFMTYGQLAVPVGEFGGYVDLGGGLGVGSSFFIGGQRVVALRAEGSLVVYGIDTYNAPVSGSIPISVRTRTTNSILSAGVGPQIYLLTGAVRPYVFGTFGFTSFVTETRVRGHSSTRSWHGRLEPFASSLDLQDTGMAFNAGAGLSVEIHRGTLPIALDVAAVYQYNGIAEYRIKGDRDPRYVDWDRWYRDALRSRRYDRDRIGEPVVSEANLVTWRIGLSFGWF